MIGIRRGELVVSYNDRKFAYQIPENGDLTLCLRAAAKGVIQRETTPSSIESFEAKGVEDLTEDQIDLFRKYCEAKSYS